MQSERNNMELTELIEQLWWYDSSMYSRTRQFHAKDDHWIFKASHSWSPPTIFRGPVSTYRFWVEYNLGERVREIRGEQAEALYNMVVDKYERQQKERQIELEDKFNEKFGGLEIE